MIEKVQKNTLFVQTEGNIVSDMAGEKVMMNVKNGKYYNLGEIGGVIWDLLGTPLTLQNLVDVLTDIYLVDKKECEKQVLTFLEKLIDEKIIVMIEHSKVYKM